MDRATFVRGDVLGREHFRGRQFLRGRSGVPCQVVAHPCAMPNPPLTIRLRHSPAFAAQSHGWCRLAPFSLDGDRMDWAVRLPKGGARRVTMAGRASRMPCGSTSPVGGLARQTGSSSGAGCGGCSAPTRISVSSGSCAGGMASCGIAGRSGLGHCCGCATVFEDVGEDHLHHELLVVEHEAHGVEPVPDVRGAVRRGRRGVHVPDPGAAGGGLRGRPEGGEARVPGKIHPGVRPPGR